MTSKPSDDRLPFSPHSLGPLVLRGVTLLLPFLVSGPVLPILLVFCPGRLLALRRISRVRWLAVTCLSFTQLRQSGLRQAASPIGRLVIQENGFLEILPYSSSVLVATCEVV